MKKLFSLFGVFFLLNFAVAQQINPYVINSSGQSFSTTSAQLSFNIGEIAITKISGANNSITQGFLQPKTTMLSVEKNELTNNYSVFPNPTSNVIYFKLKGIPVNYQIKLIDDLGKIVYSGNLTNNELSLAAYNNGLYQVIITDKQQKVIFKTSISKIN
jgi:Secretion system C-terminal sorting domain